MKSGGRLCEKNSKFGGTVTFEMGRFLTAMYGYSVTVPQGSKEE